MRSLTVRKEFDVQGERCVVVLILAVPERKTSAQLIQIKGEISRLIASWLRTKIDA